MQTVVKAASKTKMMMVCHRCMVNRSKKYPTDPLAVAVVKAAKACATA